MTGDTPSKIPLYIGIAGAIAMAVCDVILLGVPQAGSEGDIYSFTSLAQVSMFRIQIGSFTGMFASFLICAGYGYLNGLFSAFSTRLATVMFVSLAFYGVTGGFFHAGYYFAGVAIHSGDIAAYFRYLLYLKLLADISAIGLLIGIGLYVYILLYRQHSYSRWLAVFNLLTLQGIAFLVTYALPGPIGGFIKPAFINLATLSFFIIVGSIPRNSKEMPRLGAK